MFFFFVVAPFCSCPASLVSRIFFAVGPVLRSVGRRDLSAGPEQKKNTTQGVFFFCSGPGERQGKEKPRAGTGPEPKKKHHPGCFFFLLRPRGKAREEEAPLGAGTGPEQKKKNTTQGVCFFFFAPAPGKGRGRRSPVGRRHGARAKKKNTDVVPQTFLLLVFFFLLRPRADAHSLTAGLGGDASPSAGCCFFFCCGPARTGVVFFFLLWPRPDAHSLTVGWGDFGKARVVFFFFCCGPAGSF